MPADGEIDAEQQRRAADAAPLVGRTDEFARLWPIASSALAGGTGLALIEGEPGIGKTHLLDAVGAMAERHGMSVVRGRCTDGEGMPALWPWMEIISAFLTGLPPAERDAWRAGEIYGLVESADGIPTTAVLPDSGARFRLFEKVVQLFRVAASQRPVLLLMDDLQWADPASTQMFGHLADRMPKGVAVLGALRDRAPIHGPDLAAMLASVSRSPSHRRIRLGALSRDEVVQLAQNEVGDALLPALARSLHDRTAGNPFFVLELARLLVDPRSKQLDPVGGARVPPTVLDVVRDRTARLGEPARDMLRAAAVIGTEFDIGILARSVGVDEQMCLTRLQEIEELGLAEPSPGNPRVFHFVHDIVRESIVEATPLGRRPRMHLDVADAMDSVTPGDDGAVERVAYHLWSSGPLADPARTANALVRAGQAATAKFAFESAERHLQSAVELAHSAGLPDIELAALAQLTAAAGMRSGYVGSAMGPLERAEQLARELGRQREAADLLFAMYCAYSQGIQLDRAGRLARRLLDHGRASDDPVVRAYGWTAWGIHHWDIGEIGEAHESFARVSAMAFDEEPDREGWSLRRDLRLLRPVFCAITTGMHGDVEGARTILDELEVAAGDDAYALTVWASFSVVVAALAGDTEWASYAADRGIAADPEWSYGFLGSYQRLARCWARAMSGDDPAAMATEAAGIIASGMEQPARSGLATWYCLLAEMWLAADDPDQAAHALDKVDRYLDAHGQRYPEGLLLVLRAQLLRARGAPSSEVAAAARSARALSDARGAHIFSRRAEELLIGERTDEAVEPNGWERLTPTERLVVRTVGAGTTNAEAAAELFVSTHTVAAHLRSIYVKLGIGSRIELVRLVASGQVP